ncbi:MAG TPA: hypothetical protein VIM25_00695, partial [Candidatus Limnocylindrales bacterium]
MRILLSAVAVTAIGACGDGASPTLAAVAGPSTTSPSASPTTATARATSGSFAAPTAAIDPTPA